MALRLKHKKDGKKKWVMLITIFIALLMVLSIFGIILERDTTTDALTYGNYEFTRTDSGYKVKVNNTYMNFYYFPSELERINLSSDIKNKINNAQVIVFLFNPDQTQDNLIYTDGARFDLTQQMKIPVYSTITQESDNYKALPVMSCENATIQSPFIMLNISSDTEIKIDNNNPNCIIMNAKLKEIIAVQERIVYGAYGIIQ